MLVKGLDAIPVQRWLVVIVVSSCVKIVQVAVSQTADVMDDAQPVVMMSIEERMDGHAIHVGNGYAATVQIKRPAPSAMKRLINFKSSAYCVFCQ
jgi:hypothetical protein